MSTLPKHFYTILFFIFFPQVDAVVPSPMKRSSWESASDWSRMLSVAPCNSTNRKHFRMGAGLTQQRCSPLETLRTQLQRRTLQPTPPQTTGSDVIKQRLPDWKCGGGVESATEPGELGEKSVRSAHRAWISQPVVPVCRTANPVPPEPNKALVSSQVALRQNADLAVKHLTAAMEYIFTQRNRNCPFRKKSDYFL